MKHIPRFIFDFTNQDLCNIPSKIFEVRKKWSSNFLLKYILSIVFIGFIISLSVQVGDLIFSYLKRKSKLKNTGNILPGHGGILDRIDGILLGLPIGFIILLLLSKL